MKRIIVAIDGPAASGKSTAAKLLAHKLHYVYIDTGAMYRACAIAAENGKVDIQDANALAHLMDSINVDIQHLNGENRIFLDGNDVSCEIRQPHISGLASAISAKAIVREKMVDLQRKLGNSGGIVMDGRDIGTVVFPEAEVKFFIFADAEVRAKRRFQELQQKGIQVSFDDVLADLKSRDLADSTREIAPLKPAGDAIIIDNGSLSISQQVELLYSYIQKHLFNIPVIRLAYHSGFCFGVRRAIQMAEDAAKENSEVFSLGELIHNPQFVAQLEDMGVKVCNEPGSLHDETVVIRSHGITKEESELLYKQNNTVIDATCPYVKRTHELIQSAVKENYPVLILGDPTHPEVIGMRSYGDDSTLIVAPGSPLPIIQCSRLCVISQTTQKLENLTTLVNSLIPLVAELKIHNTICLATSQRQFSSACLAKHCDMMIVIGGKQSSNTKMLANLCSKITPTIHIETEDELDSAVLKGKLNLGLAAGASTPNNRILSVYNKIKKINGEDCLLASIDSIPLFKEESC